MIDDGWITVADAAQRLSITEASVYRLIDSGKLIAVRWPVRTRPEWIVACIEACRTTPSSFHDQSALSRVKAGSRLSTSVVDQQDPPAMQTAWLAPARPQRTRRAPFVRN